MNIADIINDYNKSLSNVFKFEHDWYRLAYRCSSCYNTMNRNDLTLDVCSDLLLLGSGKLRHKVADIIDKTQMIKYFSKCAKLTALRLMKSQSFFLPSVLRGIKCGRNAYSENVVVKDIKAESSEIHRETISDLEFIISNKQETVSNTVTNKYLLAKHILESLQGNYEFSYTSLANSLGLSRSTVESAMQVLRKNIMNLDPTFGFVQEKSRAERLLRKMKKTQETTEKEMEDTDPYDYQYDRYEDYELE